MPSTSVRAGYRLISTCALLGLICLSLGPALTLAQDSAVYAGSPAYITGGGAEGVLLRSDPGYDAAVVTPLWSGGQVTVLDGPYTAADGSSWYQVEAAGQVGYAPAGYLSGGGEAASTDAAPVAEQAPTEDAWVAEQAPVDETWATEQAPVEEAWAAEQPAADDAWVAEQAPAEDAWVAEQAPAAAPVSAYEPAQSVGPATTTSDVNLRAEPDGNAAVLATLAPGTPLEITGAAVAGYFPVWANGASGWVAAEYVQPGAAAPPDPSLANVPPTTDQTATTAPAPDPATGALATVADANLRAEPYPEAAVIGIVPAGASLVVSGVAENGFTPVTYNGQFGWVGNELLAGGNAAPAPDAASAAPQAGGLISWPFRGGTWEVIQGYNNGTHQNRSSFANYQYALDWAKVGGATAGETVYAPASGTISWIDRGSGGMLIDMGNGYGVAMFHVTYDGSLSRGQTIQAGTPVGTVSGPGGDGYMSTPHVDMTLWQLAGGSAHVATPFTGQFAISGVEFPDLGGGNQHMGVQVTP